MSNDLSINRKDDEIDLVELFRSLWDKKLWIILSTLIFTLIAGIYAFTAKEQWTSKAEIIPPKVLDLGDYFTIRREYARILGAEFDSGALGNALYSNFNQFIYSVDERLNFLKDSELFKTLSANKTKEQQVEILSTLATENISITKPDAKKNPDAIGNQINLSAETPELAQKTLFQLINTINQKVLQLELDSFNVWFNEKITDLNFEKEKIEWDLITNENVHLEHLNKAYETAGKAGIKEYSQFGNDTFAGAQNVVVSDAKVPYQFMLGEKYLKAQIDVENEKGIIYPARYYEIQKQLGQLQPLVEKLKTAKAQSFHYLSSPNYPVIKDKPKRVLILTIGALLGFLLASLTVLLIKK
ncbi:LPS O-antigen chain length determinant protein WzzB [Lonepinella koalarum]|uniref:Chain length determinant protein (Polysaccharide antigen chain regulator) n=1 Tax=Lonepinella koalarum TaxID=53417 RepID=A0A4R1L124_9PAST|nr:Wzz/FepE/Etk N-terminal domain-containing protein [Lonepinella koalarum]MDH2926799.1 chain length determination protein [Lonepinella koalarum]TCK70543.1 chain length determinant protein (polysaccharide antigen chain regulator) [Lonepinella koalarum]TFJ90077.1 chain length determination protein [Lonepinella koalarum]